MVDRQTLALWELTEHPEHPTERPEVLVKLMEALTAKRAVFPKDKARSA